MNTVYISLGSNQGDRAGYLHKARLAITQNIGTVALASSVYNTKPWGLENQPDFLNQVIEVHSTKTAFEVLEQCLRIELDLGRTRQYKWAMRNIDLDVLYFNDAVIATPDLKVPHEHLHLRTFVLIPLAEIAPGLVHPIMGKNTRQLINTLPTEETFKVNKYDYYSYIAVEGIIGAGKTTLMNHLSEQRHAMTIKERFDENPFLEDFYANEKQNALAVESFFMMQRYKQLSREYELAKGQKLAVVSDFIFDKTPIFASKTLPSQEFHLFREMFKVICQKTPQPDLIIYLKCTPEIALKNIANRGRAYEKNIETAYRTMWEIHTAGQQPRGFDVLELQ